MKRYRLVRLSFDFTANWLNDDRFFTSTEWDREGKIRMLSKAIGSLAYRHGLENMDQKIVDAGVVEAQAFSVISFHNDLYREVRHCYVSGAYFPALTGAVVLGERILNELILELREFYPTPPGYSEIRRKESFDDWKRMLAVLDAWDVLLPEVRGAFTRLQKTRRHAVHFRLIDHVEIGELALEALRCLNMIVGQQFGSLGSQPWYIPDTLGASYVSVDWEQNPFVRTFLLPNAAYVGPNHSMEYDGQTGLWSISDEDYEDRLISDQEFRELVNN